MSTTNAPSHATATRSTRAPLLDLLAVASVAMGIFTIVTSEMLPIGLLTSIGADFGITDGGAGLTLTLPGFLAALSAPAVTVATARVDRRLMLCAFVLLLAVANFLTAAAPSYWLVLVSRVMVGVTIGGFWSIGAGLAERLVGPESAGRAKALIFSAVPLGSVLGVPAGTFIGHLAGWRTAFAVLGAMSVAVVAMTALLVPPLPAVHVTRLKVLGGMIRTTGTRFALLTTFLVVLAHFGTYTYVTPFLEQVTHVSPGLVTVYLLVYGCAGIAGNFAGGALVARRPHAAFGLAAGLIAAATLLLPVAGRWDAGAVGLLIVWGIGYGAVPVSSQTWFSHAAPHAPEAASVLFTASFQATISLGALGGGAVVDHASVPAVMGCGAATAALMASVVWAHRARHASRPGTAREIDGQPQRGTVG